MGLIISVLMVYIFEMSPVIILMGIIAGAIVFPMMTYRIPSVNRFVLGFIVIMKITFMVTTFLFKKSMVDISIMFIAPIIIGFIAGICFAAWTQMKVLPFVLACAFLGASQLAPTIVKYINRFIFGITQDYSILFDPIDLVFAVLKIELTDGWTLLVMMILMLEGIYKQIQSIHQQGYSMDTPIISFETDNPQMHGKIIE